MGVQQAPERVVSFRGPGGEGFSKWGQNNQKEAVR